MGRSYPQGPFPWTLPRCFYQLEPKSASPSCASKSNSPPLSASTAICLWCAAWGRMPQGVQFCRGGQWDKELHHIRLERTLNSSPPPVIRRKPLPSRKCWSVLCVMARTQMGTAYLQHRTQDSSHEIPVEREGNGDRRCIHICLSWQVSFQNNTTTHSKKKKVE